VRVQPDRACPPRRARPADGESRLAAWPDRESVSPDVMLQDGSTSRRVGRGLGWRLAEIAAWAAGSVCLVAWGAWWIDARLGTHRAMTAFALQRTAGQPSAAAAAPDQTLWSPERIAAWEQAVHQPGRVPLGVLRIRRIQLEAPVLEGTDDLTLNRGLGHIEDTAVPGTDGNSGIAGHRDGFFRALKDVTPGDVIELETLGGTESYRIERTWVVNPEDVSVLDPTARRSLTLVTCYPFYFIGSAPQRYIVRAERVAAQTQARH
jgi:sortase A